MPLITLPSVPATETTFLATNTAQVESHIAYKSFNFDFDAWKNSIEAKYAKDQKIRDKKAAQNPTAEANDDSDDEEDDVDAAVYAVIPPGYDYTIQCDLGSLDPTTWREQDHYKVMGLNEFRWQTSPEDLRKAYRQLVLKYHPDKGKVSITDPSINRSDLFSCLTKSYEFLQKTKNRRSFDSYDPEFNNDVPKKTKDMDAEAFFTVFGAAMERNRRWSKHVIPSFGNNESTLEEVESFYNAMYEFESWRVFNYEQLDELAKAEDAWERRMIQNEHRKKNKGKKKEESKRMRLLVDNAWASDPRLKRFAAEEKERKAALKEEKRLAREAKKAELMAAELAAEAEKNREANELLAAEQASKDGEKKIREKAKKAIKSCRKALRKQIAAKIGDDTADVDAEISLICTELDGLKLTELTEKLGNMEASEIKAELKAQHHTVVFGLKGAVQIAAEEKAIESAKRVETAKKEKEWKVSEIQTLVKAANVFVAGTTKRWDKISAYYNDHHLPEDRNRSAKDCMAAVKTLSAKAMESKGGSALSGNSDDAFAQFLTTRKQEETVCKPLNGELSGDVKQQQPEKVDEEAAPAAEEADKEPRTKNDSTSENSESWSTAEQKMLEQALRTYPANFGKERWDKIAEVMSNRSKRDCMLRYKWIVEQLKAKKQAAAKVGGK
jgi:DnaJ family protein C protein 2